MSRILLVEDCAEHRSIVGHVLQDICTVVPVPTVADARDRIRSEAFDLILLDIELPDGTGFDLCTELHDRTGQPRVPVVFLSGRVSADEVLSGFRAGGTDYITKPFHPQELRARIEARLRGLRERGPRARASESPEWLLSGNLKFNLVRREVQADTHEGFRDLAITPSEFRLLCHFARHPGETLSRERLLQDVWGTRAAVMSDRAIDVHICQLRKKLPPGPCRIEAVYGAGYRYTDGTGEEG